MLSCSKNLEKDDYIRWVRDYSNGLHVVKRASPYSFDLQYQPAEYLSVITDGSVAQPQNDLQYYTLKINVDDPTIDIIQHQATDAANKQQLIYYYSYLFEQDIFLEEDSLKMPCVLYHAEQTDLRKTRTFVLAFENTKVTSEETVLVIQSPHFGSLPIKIRVSKKNIPTLKL